MYKLVPPKSKIIEFVSPFLKGVTFNLKVFDFDEDDKYTDIHIKSKKKVGEDSVFDSNYFYTEVFKLGVKDIVGLDGEEDEKGFIKFVPTIKLMKNVVGEIVKINNSADLEK